MEALTDKELRLIKLAATGMSLREAADTVRRSLKTVEWHMANARDKFGAPNNTRLVLLAERAGLLKDVP